MWRVDGVKVIALTWGGLASNIARNQQKPYYQLQPVVGKG